MEKTKAFRIKIKDLKKKDVGRWVIYHSFNKKELGRIKSWNDTWVFVVYHCNDEWKRFKEYTGAATHPNDLEFKFK